MRIAVCIKQIFDPQTIKISRSRQAIDESGAVRIMNPPDRWALDAALRIKEADPATEIVALTVGGREAEDVLREAMALGCDRAILLSDSLLQDTSATGMAKVVAAAIQRLRHVQLVFTGYMALDSGRGTLAPRLAIELGEWPVLMDAEQLHLENGHVQCLQYIDNCYYDSSYPLPAVVSIKETPEHPRYPNGADIMNAYRLKSVEVWSSHALGVDLQNLPGHNTKRQLRLPPKREYGVKLEGSPAEATATLLANLRTKRIL